MDRNAQAYRVVGSRTKSLSARRAWIEISGIPATLRVALLSLSARRAWIEIRGFGHLVNGFPVALRKESVDRNLERVYINSGLPSRSPQGERG